MKITKGFTLIEVLISLSIFAYVITALLALFFQFSKNIERPKKCSPVSLILIQKMLTEATNLEVSSTSEEISIEDQVLRSETNSLYIFKSAERSDFLKNKADFQLDACDVSFDRGSISTNLLFEPSRCLNLAYKSSPPDTLCALK